MSSGHDGEANHIHVLLEGRIDDLVDALMEACVDHFHPCVPESLGNYLRSPIMTIEARLRNQYTNLLLHLFTPPYRTREIRSPNIEIRNKFENSIFK